jgi:hypothetical protein
MMAVKEWITGKCPPDPPRNRLQEFATFRNALFHDLTGYAPKTTYDHTQFAPRAEKCNQADLVEAVAISLEVFCYFRSVFYGADLMPSISLGPTVELADEVIYPAYQEILASKNLSSTVGSAKSLLCPAELRASLQFLICSNGAMAHRATPLAAELIVDQHETAAIQARPTKDDVFQLPSTPGDVAQAAFPDAAQRHRPRKRLAVQPVSCRYVRAAHPP